MVCRNCGSYFETADGKCPNCQNNSVFFQNFTSVNGQTSSLDNNSQLNNGISAYEGTSTINSQIPSNNIPMNNQIPSNNIQMNNQIPGNNIPMNNQIPGNNIPMNNQMSSNNIQMNNQMPGNNIPMNNQMPGNNIPMNNQIPNNNIQMNDWSNGMGTSNVQTKKSSKKLLFIIILIIILIFIFIFSIKSFKSGTGTNFEGGSGKRTIMIYIIGSDLESEYGAASADINEMLESNFNTNDVDVVVYTGGARKWHNDEFNSNENAIYEIDGNTIKKLQFYDIEPMTDSSTLTSFINYVYANYNSDLYSLILWDHGGGPVFGYGSDENDDAANFMSLLEIDKAINDSNLIKETKFEFIGFDACLMSSIEIANMFKEEANYLIASSEVEPGQGWDYSFLSELDVEMSTEELGKNIIDYYYNYYQQLSTDYKNYYGYDYNPSITLSLINLNNIDSLIKSIDDLFLEVDSSINVSTYSKITRGVSRATMYGYIESEAIQFDLIDLYGLVSELDEYDDKVSLVQKEFDDSIIYHKSTIDDCYGMSMYFPITTRDYYSNIVQKYDYDEIVVSENYANFLEKYVSIATGDKIVKSDMSNIVPEIVDSSISVSLPSDIANNYQAADYILFKKVDDGSLLPIYVSKDVSIEKNVIRATVSNRMISVSNGEDVDYVIAVESSRDKDSITYILIGLLQYWDDDAYLESLKSEIVEIYLKVDNKTKEGKIIDIKPSISEEQMGTVPKITYNLNDWRIMQFVSYSYFLYDENNNKLSEWQKSDTIYGTEIKIADGFNFFASSLDESSEYFYMFRVKDTQGNLYESDLVAVK